MKLHGTTQPRISDALSAISVRGRNFFSQIRMACVSDSIRHTATQDPNMGNSSHSNILGSEKLDDDIAQDLKVSLPSSFNKLDKEMFGKVAQYLPLKDLFAFSTSDKLSNETRALVIPESDNLLELAKIAVHPGSSETGQVALKRLRESIPESNNIDQLQSVVAQKGLTDELYQAANTRLQQIIIPQYVTLDMLDTFIAAGADVNQADVFGDTPTHHAAVNGDLDRLTVLMAAGADITKVNASRETPVFEAVRYGNLDCLNFLIAAGADVTKVDTFGQTPTYNAAIHGHLGCLIALKEAGADMKKVDSMGQTPTHKAALHGHLGCLIALKEAGADMKKVDSMGQTPAHKAALHGHLGCLIALKEAGADMKKVDSMGQTPTSIAALCFLPRYLSDLI